VIIDLLSMLSNL